MFKRILLLLLALLTVPTAQAQNQFTVGQKAQLPYQNILTNPGYETGLYGWAKSGTSTLTQNTTAANVAFGNASAAWTPALSGETLTSNQITIPAALYGADCVASAYVKGGSAAVSLQVIDGVPAIKAQELLQAETAFKRYDLRFTCPSSGTLAVRLQASASSSVVYVDQWSLSGTPRVQAEGDSNSVDNGNAEDNFLPSGWAVYNDGAVAAPVDGTGGTSTLTLPVRDTTAPITDKASWKFSTPGSATSEGQGWAYSFTIPANSSLKNALNDLTFDYYQDNTTSDLVRVYLYDVTNSQLITPQFTTCGGGTNPSLASLTSGTTCQAKLSWLASATSTSYRLILHVSDNAGAVTAAHNLWVDNLFVGQHKVAVGTQVSQKTAWTPTLSAGWGTTSAANFSYTRVGPLMQIEGKFTMGTVAASEASVTLPAGLHVDMSNYGVGMQVIGKLQESPVESPPQDISPAVDVSFNDRIFFVRGIAGGLTKMLGSNFATSAETVSFTATVPIAEWAGGSAFGENKCEYAYNSGNVTAAGGSDTASFGYGPAGTPILAYNSTTVSSNTAFTVQFQTPISQTDDTAIQIYNGVQWQGTADATVPPLQQNTCTYGVQGVGGSAANQMLVRFGNCGFQSGNSTYGGTGANWNTLSTWRWRVKKCKAGIPTPFGLANATTPGLVSGADSGTFTANFTGPRTTSSTISYTRLGNVVVLTLPTNNGSACAVSTAFQSPGSIPSSLRPVTNDFGAAIHIQDNSVASSVPGFAQVSSGGNLLINKDWNTGNFTASGNCGWYSATITYSLQ